MGALASRTPFDRFALVAAVPMLVSFPGGEEDLTLDCEFTTTFTTTHVLQLEDGKVEKVDPSDDGLRVTFTGFAPRSKSVTVVGDPGTSSAKYDLNDQRLMILEFTDTGNVMVTSIEAPTTPPVVAGVHTRNTWMGSKALISTMGGRCMMR